MTDTAPAPASEALVAGVPSFSDVQQLVRRALRARAATSLDGYHWVWIVDMTATHVVYEVADDELWQCSYTVNGAEVDLGEPERVARAYVAVSAGGDQGDGELAAAVESAQPGERDHLVGRVLEAKTDSSTGGRVFAVRIIAVGDSLNGNRYSEAVLAAAAPLYEGAKAYDRHRSAEDLKSGTIAGLVGHYRNVTASAEGLDADLYLLPSATHAAEVLDAALAAQADGLPPTAGISHDVLGTFRPLSENGRQLREATAITHVFSADVVSDPSAGGRATRVVAGGIHLDQLTPAPSGPTTHQQENAMPEITADAVLAALESATPEQLARAGVQRTAEATTTAPAATTPTAVEQRIARESFAGRSLVRGMVAEVGLPEAVVETIVAALPEQISESDVSAQIAGVQAIVAGIERAAGLTPEVGGRAQVTRESFEKKVEALDLFFNPNEPGGYTSFVQAYVDITGDRQTVYGGDFSRKILRESFASPFDSAVHVAEGLDTTSWPQVLGDSITRRAVAEYARPNLQTWKLVVSSTPTVTDFRQQRVDRIGGYGVLPKVAEAGVYQQLTSPTDEEATYVVEKRGGIEVITWEMIRNDDVRALSRIPGKLGLAAAQTLYRFVWDMFVDNLPTTYDSTSLFHASHGNTDNPATLSQSTLSAARQKMGVQAAYGDSKDVLSIEPKYLVIPAGLEEIAFQLSTSAVAIPATPAGPSNTPNIHSAKGLTPIKVPYYTNQSTWFVVADPSQCPTIEIGFLDGKQTPDFFTQADPNAGSTFSADKHEIKVRQVYSGTVLDHRGMYRGVGA